MSIDTNCEELRNIIAERFDAVCCVDLADLHDQHRKVFDLFRQHYKSYYHPRERLILYSCHELQQSFIDHIQYAASRIDISNFFILFVTSHDLSDKLALANLRYGNDHIPMQNLVIELDASKAMPSRGYADRSFLCPLPFMAVEITAEDSVSPCCKYRGSEGNLATTDLKTIFNGQFRAEIRQQIIAGSVPPGCQTCVDIERSGSTSQRQLMMNKYGNLLDQQKLDDPSIIDITISPSSICNYKCRICKPSNSSSIRAEEILMAENLPEANRIKKTFPIYNSEKFSEILADPDVAPDFIHILGGEPFLWPGLPSILNQLTADQRSKKLHLEFNTNGSVIPDYLEIIADQFKMIEILVSIDAIGPRFELQRGGSWSMILNNLEKFAWLNKKSNVSVKLAPTVNIQNLLYLNDLVKLSEDIEVDVVWSYLEDPVFLCIDNVTSAVKHRVKEIYQDHTVEELRKISHRMFQCDAVSGQSFLDYTKKIDQRRKQDFRKFHREICELMEIPV